MVKVLLLFDKYSVQQKLAYPAKLSVLLQKTTAGSSVGHDRWENLLFFVSQAEAAIVSKKTRRDIRDNDVVYFRRMERSTGLPLAAAIYLKKNNVPFVDEEAYLRGTSFNKLSQMFRLWENSLPFPRTIFGISSEKDLWFFRKHLGSFPVVVKSSVGTRGADNYLVSDEKELIKLLDKYPKTPFMIQEYIPNKFDYRFFVAGSGIEMVIKRTRPDSSHKNNVSLGAKASLVDANGFSKTVAKDVLKAARIFGRSISGVDVIISEKDKKHYLLEVNRAPQIEGSSFEKEKAKIVMDYLIKKSIIRRGKS